MKEQILGTIEIILIILIGISIIFGGIIAIIATSPILIFIGILWLIHEILERY